MDVILYEITFTRHIKGNVIKDDADLCVRRQKSLLILLYHCLYRALNWNTP